MNGHTLGILIIVAFFATIIIIDFLVRGWKAALVGWSISLAASAILAVGIVLAIHGDLSSIQRMFGFY